MITDHREDVCMYVYHQHSDIKLSGDSCLEDGGASICSSGPVVIRGTIGCTYSYNYYYTLLL